MSISAEPPVVWFDDFIGVRIGSAYCVTLSGAGVVRIADGLTGGAVLLASAGEAQGAARLRLGEDPGTGPFNALNFSAQKNLVYEARVYFNRNTNIEATIGLVGLNDPQNVLAAIYHSGDDVDSWGFQVINDSKGTTTPTGFTHQPGNWFRVRIEVSETARIYFNGEEVPRVEIPAEFIPLTGLCPEFQIWNVPLNGVYSQPTMWVDYLSVRQDR